MTLGSLFDGSGGFPLAAIMNGITPIWASEIEEFPIEVTKKNFPEMKHLGDITKLDGGKLPPVDIITFSSPCQDLSVAGKRAGLVDGERSSLFFDAIRVIKEMREATNGQYPRYIVWENVYGALTSQKGEDYRNVIEQIAKIKDTSISIPRPRTSDNDTVWRGAGMVRGADFSLAWRVMDARYWGVPQRRRRVFLVADFRGDSAGKILFNSESSRGNTQESEEPRQNIATRVAVGIDGKNSDVKGDYVGTLKTNCGSSTGTTQLFIENHGTYGRIKVTGDTCQTLTSRMGTGGNNVPLVLEPETQQKVFVVCSDASNGMRSSNPNTGFYETESTRTLDTNVSSPECNQGGMVVVGDTFALQGSMIGRKDENGPQGSGINKNECFTLNATDKHAVAYSSDTGSFQHAREEETNTLGARDYKQPQIVSKNHFVRSLTPLECCRLQGFPDGWTDGVKGYTDAKAYKMWGNGVALPCVNFIIGGIAKYGK